LGRGCHGERKAASPNQPETNRELLMMKAMEWGALPESVSEESWGGPP